MTTPAERPSLVLRLEYLREYIKNCTYQESVRKKYLSIVQDAISELAAIQHDISRSVATSSELATELAAREPAEREGGGK